MRRLPVVFSSWLVLSSVKAMAHITAEFTPTSMRTDPVTNMTGVPWDETTSITIHMSCADTDVCTFNSKRNLTIDMPHANRPITVELSMQATFIGRSHMLVHAYDAATGHRVTLVHDPFPVTVLRSAKTQMLNMIFTIFMIVFVTVNVFMMGTQLHWEVILRVLRKPVGPVIGFVCQYILMPMMAYLWARVFLDGYPMLQFGYFAYGCSPGGGNSNFWTILLDGNLDLSITMTFLSNAAALFMMPFWLFTLGQTFYDDTVTIPFVNIGLTLFSMLVPAVGGMYLGKRRPQWIPLIKKIIKWFTLTILVVIVFFSFYVNWFVYLPCLHEFTDRYIFLLMRWYTLLPGFLLVAGGYLIAYILAMTLGQRHREARTISIETGIQNAGIAIIICQLSLDAPDSDMTLVMPICCLVFTGLPLWLWLASRAIRRKWCGWHDQDVLDDEREAEEAKRDKEKVSTADMLVSKEKVVVVVTKESSI